MRTIKKLFSTPLASVIGMVFSILARIGFLKVFMDIGPDKSGLILMTRNLLHGHGIVIDTADPGNMGQIIHEHFYRWPPAYNFLLAPVLWLMEDKFMMAAFIVDIAINVIFFIYLRKLLLLIGFPVWLTNLFLLFQALAIQPYVVESNPTDFIGFAFLTMSIYHILQVTKAQSFSGIHSWMAGLLLAVAALTRYHYIPVSIILAIILLYQGWRHRYSGCNSTGIMVFSLVPVLIGVVLLYQKISSGSFVDMVNPPAGFFPSNLQFTYPFIAGGIMNVNFYALQLSQVLHTDYTVWVNLARVATFIVAAILLFIYTKWIIRNRNEVRSSIDNFWLFGGMTALLSVGLLVALSLLRSIDMGPPMFYWTFVVEERYYAFPLLFIGILAWYWLFVLPAHSPGKKILSYLLVGTIAIEMLHGIYFLSKKLTGPLPSISESGWARPQMAFTKQFILEEQAKGNKVIVTSYVRQFGFMAGWLGAGALFEPLKINTATFASDGPAVLLAVIDKKELGYFKPFLQRPGVRWVHSTADYYFYTLYVGTGTNL